MTFIEVIAIIILAACLVRLNDRLEELEEENAKNRDRLRILSRLAGDLGLDGKTVEDVEFRPVEHGKWKE